MAPRAYKSQKRAEAVAETRRRITEAVVQLHREKGVISTTYDDIARRADVAPATVYRHFPSVDDLIPACGARIDEITTPPAPMCSTAIGRRADGYRRSLRSCSRSGAAPNPG